MTQRFENLHNAGHQEMLVQYSDDEDDSEALVLTQDPASNVKVTVHIPPPPQPPNNNDEEEENYLNLNLLQGAKRPAITQPRADREEKDNSDSSDDDTTIKVTTRSKR